jgi:hypothetical protein
MDEETRKKLFLVEIAMRNGEHDHIGYCNFSREIDIRECPTCNHIWKFEAAWDWWMSYRE